MGNSSAQLLLEEGVKFQSKLGESLSWGESSLGNGDKGSSMSKYEVLYRLDILIHKIFLIFFI